jgi:hypothetical protein
LTSSHDIPFGNDVSELEIVAAVEHGEEATGRNAPSETRVAGKTRDPHPEHIDRRADVLDFEAGLVAHGRMTAIAADDETRAHIERAVRRYCSHADDAATLLNEIGDVRLHDEVEARIALASVREEIEEVPLRHQGDERSLRRQKGKVGEI